MAVTLVSLSSVVLAAGLRAFNFTVPAQSAQFPYTTVTITVNVNPTDAANATKDLSCGIDILDAPNGNVTVQNFAAFDYVGGPGHPATAVLSTGLRQLYGQPVRLSCTTASGITLPTVTVTAQ